MDNKEVLEKKVRESDRLLKAYTYGNAPDFLEKNNKLINDVEKRVKLMVAKNGNEDESANKNTLNNIKNLIYNNTSFYETKEVEQTLNKQLSTSSGTRFITPDNQVPLENQIIDLYGNYIKNTQLLAIEYRNIAKLIPEVNECANLICTSVINKNNFNGKYITNIYKPKVSEKNSSFEDSINEELREKIVVKYGIEDKVESYIQTSMIESAKPVAVFSYREIMETIQNALNSPRKGSNQNYNDGKYDMTRQQISEKISTEDFQPVLDSVSEGYSILKQCKKKYRYKTMGTEDDTSSESLDEFSIEDFLGRDIVDQYYNASMEDVKNVVERNYHDRVAALRVRDELDTELSGLDKEYADVMGKINKADKDKIMDVLKNEIYEVVKHIDDNIKIYKGDYAGINLAKDQIAKYFMSSDIVDTDKTSFIARNAKSYQSPKQHDYSEDPIFDKEGNRVRNSSATDDSGIADGSYTGRKDGKSGHWRADPNGYDAREDVNFWKNEALIIPLDIENVIPVIINGTHVGYYVFEESAYTGSNESSRKRHSSFTELFRQLGFSNDEALTNYSSYGGFNNLGGSDQLNLMAGNGLNASTWTYNMVNGNYGDMYNSQNLSTMTDPVRRNEIMKQIVLKTISKKISGVDLSKDKKFKDSIMNLLREGLIVNKKVVISYVPESQMCFFTPRLDADGIPVSLLKDCLWVCYLYISSVLGSAMIKLMKSGTRDKITFDVGEMKDIQGQMRWIDKSLTSRSLNVESAFTSLPRTLKAASTTDTVYEPTFDGKKLFEYEDITRVNNVDVDDNYTTELLNRIIQSMGAPSTVVNIRNEEEFATSVITKNVIYEKRVNSYKSNFNKPVTKLLRLLVQIEHLDDDPKNNKVKRFNIDDIEHTFTKSQDLNITNVDSSLKDATNHIETISNLLYGDTRSDTLQTKSKELFKLEVIQELVPNFDYDQYKELKEKCDVEAKKRLADDNVSKNISEKIENEQIKLGEDENETY